MTVYGEASPFGSTANGYASVLEAAEEVDQETAVVVWLMARAGLRIGEVLALKRRDVDIRGRLLHVRGSMSRREGAVCAGLSEEPLEVKVFSVWLSKPESLTGRLRVGRDFRP